MIRKKRKFKRGRIAGWLASLLAAGFIICFVGMLLTSNIKLKMRRNEIFQQIEATKKEIQDLENANKKLENQIIQQGSSDYLEQEARERYNLKKPGEEVAVILGPSDQKSSEQDSASSSAKPETFWQKIKGFFAKFWQ